jgi:tetratricopeptide (TPR) repeat protein
MIEVIDENKENFSDKNYDVIKGEALGLRSFLYFDLVRLFAKSYSEDSTSVAVPYINKLSSEIVSPSKLNEILNLLIEDIKNSISLLENDDLYLNIYGSNVSAVEGRKFYFNYYAAKALLARVYLYKGDFENALMHSEELINDNLVKKNFDWVLYTDLGGTSANKRDRTFAKEVIFSLNDLYITPTWETTFSSVDDGFNSEGGWYKLGDVSYVNSCFERDVYTSSIDYRREYLIESSVNALYYYPTKLIQLSETETRFKNRIPLIRLSEVYYIAAECQKELGNLQAALDYINTVRDHRGYSVADRLSLAVVDDAIKVQNEIFKEYRKEFICEGQMFYYYKRFNSENIYDLKNNLVSTFSRDKSVLPVPDNEKIYGDWNK